MGMLLLAMFLPRHALGEATSRAASPTTRQAKASSVSPRTIAVLTFKNLKGDRKSDWIGEGAAETLTTKLAGVDALVVIERNQVKRILDERAFQKTDLADPSSAAAVGKELGAQRIVIGTFATEGGGIMFNVRVVDVGSSVVLSAANVTGPSGGIFDTLLQLAEAVIRSFDKKVVIVGARHVAVDAPASERIVLTAEQKQRLRKHGTTNAKAYGAFAKGMAAKTDDTKIRYLTEAIAHDPKYAWAFNNRGNAYASKRQYDRAIRDYDKALALKTDYALSYRNRGLSYAKTRQHDRAIRDFSKAIAMQPNYAPAYYSRGLAHAVKGRFREAIDDYDTSLLLHPRQTMVFYNKAQAYERLGRRIEAAAAYRRFIALSPNRKDSRVRKAQQRVRSLERR